MKDQHTCGLETRLKSEFKWVLHRAEELIKEVKDNNLQDSQFVLDWLDSLNKLSVTW